MLQPFIRSPSAAQVSLLITSFLVAAARRARQYIPFDALSPRARQCEIVPCFLSPIVPLARARGVVLCVARAVARSCCGPWHRCMPRRGRSRFSRATRPSSTRLWEATSAAECRKLALDGDRHWRLRTLWRRRRSLAVAALLHLWRGPLANSPRTTMPNSFAQACWAVLFISNNTEEPTEHTQMRFELASSTLAERIQLGIVAVHEAPEAAAEFLTMDTPQIGASMTTPYLLAATHAARARPVRVQVRREAREARRTVSRIHFGSGPDIPDIPDIPRKPSPRMPRRRATRTTRTTRARRARVLSAASRRWPPRTARTRRSPRLLLRCPPPRRSRPRARPRRSRTRRGTRGFHWDRAPYGTAASPARCAR